MKHSFLSTLAIAAFVWLSGCDAQSPHADTGALGAEVPATAATDQSGGTGTAAEWLSVMAERRSDPRVSAPGNASSALKYGPPSTSASGAAVSQRDRSVLADEENPQPMKVLPEDANRLFVQSDGTTSLIPPPPCEDGPEGPAEGCVPGGGGGGGGGGSEITDIIWFSRIYSISGYAHMVSAESHSYAADEYGNPKNINYIGTTGKTYGNGLLLRQKSAGLNNGAYAITQTYQQSSATTNWRQNGSHTFTVSSSSGSQTYNETSVDYETW